MTIPYKYPSLVKEINFAWMAAEYNTLIPALGIVLLDRIGYHMVSMSINHESAWQILARCRNECISDYKDAMKVYSNL